MAVRVAEAIEDMAEDAMRDFVYNDVVPAAKNFAPNISGKLANSIRPTQIDRFEYIVGTHATGYSGCDYPLHIELGQPAIATIAPVLKFRVHGRWVSKKKTSVHASSTGFMKKTVSHFGG